MNITFNMKNFDKDEDTIIGVIKPKVPYRDYFDVDKYYPILYGEFDDIPFKLLDNDMNVEDAFFTRTNLTITLEHINEKFDGEVDVILEIKSDENTISICSKYEVELL